MMLNLINIGPDWTTFLSSETKYIGYQLLNSRERVV